MSRSGQGQVKVRSRFCQSQINFRSRSCEDQEKDSVMDGTKACQIQVKIKVTSSSCKYLVQDMSRSDQCHVKVTSCLYQGHLKLMSRLCQSQV